ncbi:4-(cytidine 5'-diphospho)-2-C-methyl-D-erythritol kinase [Aliiruegeria sabulilitoris]|uniref:4-(cytidine 5'-diphospho)-2-C-methyl-D-erythritol kinase n=1 Tax=Aliiruegeria sabulilitoris TaxID=1510458 RepID=UPI000836A055|nr:4-(cytidine 5'-diphospho)-2-C-methyl-D-erythritol kinase [Aliiruegeria sabulilitoris]NDR57773.1 4-(cytidine 5'-diphospho)-2-C-methyl-D-erythritol kinase [Pseudoruegeria sp. M32A2M]
MASIEEFAPAKVNLTLHVTGRREDGYHLLDSLVVFADTGDRVFVEDAEECSFTVTGPRAAGIPTDASNLVLKAAALMGAPRAAITLDKHLPAASGIGGGSADAAATLRALARLLDRPLPDIEAVARLGADIPVCLEGRAVRMRGIGERLNPVASLPPLPAVLVNPGVEVSTPEVFRRLSRRDNPEMAAIPKDMDNPACVSDWLKTQRNDLEGPAREIAAEIGEALDLLDARPDCLLARMSGSGATCFGLYPSAASAQRAAAEIGSLRPEWWTRPTLLA